jgi:hypothetical protein
MGGEYRLGTGDYFPFGPDVPGRNNTVPWSSDCAGFAICYAWKIVRHRPGFNDGPWASVSDDVNVNSVAEDGLHRRELFTTLATGALPQPGDLLCYPTFIIPAAAPPHQPLTFIGHVALIETVPTDYRPGEGWDRLTLLQCRGPNGRRPAVLRTDGSIFAHHDAVWPLPEHHCVVVRPHERS